MLSDGYKTPETCRPFWIWSHWDMLYVKKARSCLMMCETPWLKCYMIVTSCGLPNKANRKTWPHNLWLMGEHTCASCVRGKATARCTRALDTHFSAAWTDSARCVICTSIITCYCSAAWDNFRGIRCGTHGRHDEGHHTNNQAPFTTLYYSVVFHEYSS